MKLVILGATGGCGRHLVTQALARGHEVCAVARPTTSYEAPEGVTVATGQVFDGAFLEQTFRGADVVLSALGLKLPGLSPFAKPEVPDLLSRSTPIIVDAMKRAGVGRVIAISAGGAGDSYEVMPGVFKAFMKTTSLRKVYPELDVMERVYFESGLDACCCRPTGLSDDPATGRVTVATRLVGRAMIPRADVAGWMLDAIEQRPFAERGPIITVTGAA